MLGVIAFRTIGRSLAIHFRVITEEIDPESSEPVSWARLVVRHVIGVKNDRSSGKPLRKADMSAQATTSQHMLLFRGTHWDKELSPEEIQNVMSEWTAWFDRLTQQGKAKAGQPLFPEGKIVSGKKGRTVGDGPFVEAKEAIAGYIALQVRDLNEAVEIAKECPGLEYGITIEVRPVDGRMGRAPA
jgi:hypothetical protein